MNILLLKNIFRPIKGSFGIDIKVVLFPSNYTFYIAILLYGYIVNIQIIMTVLNLPFRGWGYQ